MQGSRVGKCPVAKLISPQCVTGFSGACYCLPAQFAAQYNQPILETRYYEELMDTEAKPTQQSGNAKKPYQAPELVVMGDAAEITQAGPGFFALDGATFPTATAS